MLTKNKIKFIQSLADKKGRRDAGLFLVEGEKMVGEALVSNFEVKEIYATANWWEQNDMSGFVGLKEIVKMDELKKISSLITPNRVLAIVSIPEVKIDHKNLVSGWTIVLDKLQDPGNLGTIIRTADWFGIKNIICSSDSVDVYNPKVVQATMGSVFRIAVHYLDLSDFILAIKKQDKECLIYGATMEGDNIFDKKLNDRGILVFGNESQGISQEVIALLDKKISIPHDIDSQAESLNVAVSVGVLISRL